MIRTNITYISTSLELHHKPMSINKLLIMFVAIFFYILESLGPIFTLSNAVFGFSMTISSIYALIKIERAYGHKKHRKIHIISSLPLK